MDNTPLQLQLKLLWEETQIIGVSGRTIERVVFPQTLVVHIFPIFFVDLFP